VACAFELLPQFRIVEYLAVIDNPHSPVFVVNRLGAASKVNYAKPGMPKTCKVIKIYPHRVRASVMQSRSHKLKISNRDSG
jgi:hypothetical protein